MSLLLSLIISDADTCIFNLTKKIVVRGQGWKYSHVTDSHWAVESELQVSSSVVLKETSFAFWRGTGTNFVFEGKTTCYI